MIQTQTISTTGSYFDIDLIHSKFYSNIFFLIRIISRKKLYQIKFYLSVTTRCLYLRDEPLESPQDLTCLSNQQKPDQPIELEPSRRHVVLWRSWSIYRPCDLSYGVLHLQCQNWELDSNWIFVVWGWSPRFGDHWRNTVANW